LVFFLLAPSMIPRRTAPFLSAFSAGCRPAGRHPPAHIEPRAYPLFLGFFLPSFKFIPFDIDISREQMMHAFSKYGIIIQYCGKL
ncbi:MAG: hypothetical protein ILM98_07440, partial [Kiritimatiellae bacterium]|nr:hypothetical protein [Kiritimatiellia bacterium]